MLQQWFREIANGVRHPPLISQPLEMRPLTEEETRIFFEKLHQFIGANIKQLLERPDEHYVFRLHNQRVYYLPEKLVRLSTNLARENLVSMGTRFGKFSKKGDAFRLHITALDYLSKYALHKVWVKPSAEMSFLYGNHVIKSGVGRMSDAIVQYSGVIVYSMRGIALGFGVASHSTAGCRELDPMGICVLHQCDVGEYLRCEDEMF